MADNFRESDWMLSRFARLRRWYWRHLRRYHYEICHRCGRPVRVVWTASNELWNVVEGSPYGIRCTSCFDVACAESGRHLRWAPVVEHTTFYSEEHNATLSAALDGEGEAE